MGAACASPRQGRAIPPAKQPLLVEQPALQIPPISADPAPPLAAASPPVAGELAEAGVGLPSSPEEAGEPPLRLSSGPGVNRRGRRESLGKKTRFATLTITVYSARNLLAKDSNGLSDPYCVVHFNKQEFKTRIIPCNLNPVWDPPEIFTFTLYQVDAGRLSSIRVVLFDDDSIQRAGQKPAGRLINKNEDLGADDFLGQVELELPLVGGSSRAFYLLRQRSRRSHVAGEVEIGLSLSAVEFDFNRLAKPRPGTGTLIDTREFPFPAAHNGMKEPHPRPWPVLEPFEPGHASCVVQAQFDSKEGVWPFFRLDLYQNEFAILRIDPTTPPSFLLLLVLIIAEGVRLVDGSTLVIPLLGMRTRSLRLRFSNETEALAWASLLAQSQPVYRYDSRFDTVPCSAADLEIYGCGSEYYARLVESILNAKSFICIADWYISPEVHLKRDVLPLSATFRLDNLLRSKAETGVKVFILIFDDHDLIGLASSRAVKIFNGLHGNIAAMRHGPVEIKDAYFSHHQKFVIADGHTCFVGGIDLCFGRYDEPNHPVVDAAYPFLWPGADYYNPRMVANNMLDRPFVERADRSSQPRMPWQDAHAKFEGEVAYSLTMLFAQRWTHHRLNLEHKVRKHTPLFVPPTRARVFGSAQPAKVDPVEEKAADTLPMPNGDLASQTAAPEGESGPFIEAAMRPETNSAATSSAPCTAQLLSSQCEWSGHVSTDRSIHTAMIDVISRAEKFIYIEQQFFITSCDDDDRALPTNTRLDVLAAPLNNSLKAFSRARKSVARRADKIVKRLSTKSTGDSEDDDDNDDGAFQLGAQGNEDEDDSPAKPEMVDGTRPAMEALRARVEEKMLAFEERRPHVRRNLRRLMRRQKEDNEKLTRETVHRTKIFNKVGKALYERIARAIDANGDFHVIVVLPDYPEGHYAKEKYSQAVMHYQSHSVCLGKDSLLGRLIATYPHADVSRYVSFYSLRSYGFCGVVPMHENVYVHSKLMLVDDKHMMVGSANINDRSLLGVRDSEVAVLLENAPEQVTSFRKRLWSRHLGMNEQADAATLSDVSLCYAEWQQRALSNTAIFEKVWPDCPSSRHTTMASINGAAKGPLDPGKLGMITGFVIEHPRFFLSQEEDLLPPISRKEGALVDYSMFQ